jgi:hypothetical protein
VRVSFVATAVAVCGHLSRSLALYLKKAVDLAAILYALRALRG